jgi:integrase
MPYIMEWLNTYPKKSTRKVFKAGAMHFLNHIYGPGDLEAQASKYVQEYKSGQRDPFKDLLSFAASLADKPPKTCKAYVPAAKSFLEYTLNFEFTTKQSRLITNRLPKGKARTVEADITRDDLKAILNQCDLKGRALFLFLASTGMRIGEALQITLDDLNLQADPPTVLVRQQYTKTGAQYYTFLTTEAKEALIEWLKIRESYIKSALNRGIGLSKTAPGRGVKSPEDRRVFPFSKSVAEQMWYNAIEKAGLNHKDPSTGRYRWRIHMLRKWFISQAKLAAPENVVEAWAGHVGYLDDAYRRYTKQQLAELYKKAEPYLLINVSKDVVEIQSSFKSELESAKAKILDLTTLVIKLQNENEDLRKRLNVVEERVKEFLSKFGEV